jgi:pimeloyl-ACP methyl ester carboxylesterase
VHLNHVRQGSGEPLLLIHGLGSQHQMWRPVIDRLASAREVIALDLPGFGGSAPFSNGTAPSAAAFAAAIAGFLDQIGWETAHIAGNSLGGWTGLELAKRGRARSVAAISPAGFGNPREARFSTASLRLSNRSARLIYGVAPALLSSGVGRRMLFCQMIYRADRMTPEAAVGALRNLADSPGVDDTLDFLASEAFSGGEAIDVPVTMIWGDREMLLARRERQAARSLRAVPGARLVWLRGCGHVPTWDDPPAVAQAILEASGSQPLDDRFLIGRARAG